MIVPSMSRKEIAAHLVSEVNSNRSRIENKVMIVAKKMRGAKKKVEVYKQRIGNNTEITVYIYGVTKKSVDYAAGLWYQSDKGKCWVTSGKLDEVVFYNDHFFQRYSERYLKKPMSTFDAAQEYYKEFKVSAGSHTGIISEGVYKFQLPLQAGGLALGVHDTNNRITIYNTYVSAEMLKDKQFNYVEAYREVNDSILNMNYSEWILLGRMLNK